MPAIAYEPNDKDRAVVKALAAYGVPQEQIGARIGISHVTLRKYYQSELDLSAMEANAKVAEFLFQSCIATVKEHGKEIPDPRFSNCRFFWLKTRAGWREVERIEHVGGDGEGPVRIIVEYEDRPAKASAPASGTE
jgi:hypothetical protein